MSVENVPEEKNQTRSYQLIHALSQRLSILRWLVLTFGLSMVTLHQLLEGAIRRNPILNWEFVELIYGVLISLAAWMIITWLRRSVRQTETAELALGQTLNELSQANERLEYLLHVNHRLSEAEDDNSLAELIIDLFMSKAPAAACSMIRYDPQKRTLPIAYREEGSAIVFDDQMPHYSANEIERQCKACAKRADFKRFFRFFGRRPNSVHPTPI